MSGYEIVWFKSLFKPTKWFGIIFGIVYALGLFTSGDVFKHPGLQKSYMAFMLSGCIVATLEAYIDNWAFCGISTFSFAVALVLEIVLSFLTHNFSDFWLALCITIVFAFRMVRLYRKEHENSITPSKK